MCIGRLPVSKCGRLVADTLKSVTELKKDNDTRMSQYVQPNPPKWPVLMWCCCRITTAFQEERSASRKGEEKRLAQLVFPRVSKESSLV